MAAPCGGAAIRRVRARCPGVLSWAHPKVRAMPGFRVLFQRIDAAVDALSDKLAQAWRPES
jgi:hypothetical protein